MPVQDLNHINIRAPQPQLNRVRDFYVNVLGLQPGWRPEVPVAGYWLYLGERPVLHLMVCSADAVSNTGTGHIDHFAFSCSGPEAMEQQLQQWDVPYLRRDFPQFNMLQLVVTDPLGNPVELNFSLDPVRD